MRVLLADDRPEVRSALRLLLEQEPGLEAVVEVAETRDLLIRALLSPNGSVRCLNP